MTRASEVAPPRGVKDPLPIAVSAPEGSSGHPAGELPLPAPERQPRWVRPLRIAILAVVDAAVLLAAAVAGVLFWAVNVRQQPASVYVGLAPLVALFTVAYAKAGLYPGFGIGAVATLRRLVLWTSFVFLILAAASFALKAPYQYSRVAFAIAWAASLPALPLARFALSSVMRRVSWWNEPVVLVGTGPLALRAVESLLGALTLGYRPRWVLATHPFEKPAFAGVPVVGGIERAAELGARGVRVALVTDEDQVESRSLVQEMQRHFRRVILLRGKGLPIEGVVIRNLGGVLGLEFHNQLLLRRNRFAKRCLDLALGSVFLLLAAPLIAVAALAVKAVSRGPVFFSQWREGLDGRPIRVWKVRTMHLDAEERLAEHLASDPEAEREWRQRFKLERDPRILPVVGRLLRRWSLDELPQLWSVVSGQMSLVGPRPFPDYHLEQLSASHRELRRRVRPGLTGLWQVTVRSSGDLEQQEFFDSYYIRNWSLWMDLYILARTGVAVLSGSGAH